jgi:hypothetical protein
MNKKSPLTLVIALLCLAAYVIALSWGAYRVFVNIKSNRAIADRDFYELREELSSQNARSFMNADYQRRVEETLARSRPLMGVIVSGSEGNYAFEREAGGIINWVDDSPRFAKRFGVTSRPLFSPLQIEGLRNVNLYAVYGHIEYADFLFTLRRALLIVLGALTAAFLCLILETALEKRESAGERAAEETPAEPDADLTNDLFSGAETAETAGGREAGAGNISETDLISGPDPFADEDDETAAMAEPVEDEAADGDFDAEPAGFGEAAAEPFPQTAVELPAAEPYTKFGVGPEINVLKQLTVELEKARKYREDLSLMVAYYGNPDDPDGIWFADFVRIAIDTYKIRDLIFENGKQGLAVIIPNTDLDRAIRRAQEFRSVLPSTFTQSLNIGISARANRTVPPNRLLLEASHAAQRAAEDPASPIVAFKSDPEKYRAFVEGKR